MVAPAAMLAVGPPLLSEGGTEAARNPVKVALRHSVHLRPRWCFFSSCLPNSPFR